MVLTRLLVGSALNLASCGPTAAFFFVQAEDGIRGRTVTGVQTCALPILFYQHGSQAFASLKQSRNDGYYDAARNQYSEIILTKSVQKKIKTLQRSLKWCDPQSSWKDRKSVV